VRTKKSIGIAAVVTAAAIALTGCASQSPSASASAGNGGSASGARVKIGFVVHVLGDPFIQQIIDGAKAAAADENVDLQVTGPTDGSADTQLKQIQNLVAAGVQGIATSVKAASMTSTLNQIVDSGVPVVQFNMGQKGVKAPYVGEAATQAGRILAQKVLDKLGGTSATGKVLLGNCFPGDPSLDERGAGAQEVFKTAPGIKVLGQFDVKVAANVNYASWEALLAANPDAKALIGLCAPDVTSLGKLQAANPQTRFVAGGFDLTTQNLEQIANGDAYVSLGQSAFAQGYLPVKILADAIRNHIDLSKGGFINAGTEIVTKDSVEEPNGLPALSFGDLQKMAASPEVTRKYYQPAIDSYYHDWQSHVEPIANVTK